MKKNSSSEYVVIRVIALHVQRKFCLLTWWREKELGKSVAIPNSPEKAVELFDRLTKIMKEYGVEIKP